MAIHRALVFENEDKFRIQSYRFLCPHSSGEAVCGLSVDVNLQTEECPPATGEDPTSSHPPQDNDRVSLSQ